MNIIGIINSLSDLLDNVADHTKAYIILFISLLISAIVGVPLLVFYRDPDRFLLLDNNPYIGLEVNAGTEYVKNKDFISSTLRDILRETKADRVLLYVYKDESIYLVAEDNRPLFNPIHPSYYINDVEASGFKERLREHYYGACSIINKNDVDPDTYLYTMMKDMGSIVLVGCPSLSSSFVIDLSFSTTLDSSQKGELTNTLRSYVRILEDELFPR